MRRSRQVTVVLLGLFFCGYVLHGQQLIVQTQSGTRIALTPADIEALPHVSISVAEHAQAAVSYDGVAVRSVLEKAGVNFGDSMKGKRLATCLVVEAADGYRVVIALPELDPAFTNKQIVLAFGKDGKSLDEKEGPYRIVIPEEKKMARWVKQVTALKIVDVP